MKRRNFVQRSLAAVSTLAVSSVYGSPPPSPDEVGIRRAQQAKSMPVAKPFKLNYAPHDGMFKNNAGTDFVDQIKFMHDQGFRSVEELLQEVDSALYAAKAAGRNRVSFAKADVALDGKLVPPVAATKTLP